MGSVQISEPWNIICFRMKERCSELGAFYGQISFQNALTSARRRLGLVGGGTDDRRHDHLGEAAHAQRARRARRQIDNPATLEGSPVIDAHDDGATSALVGDAGEGAEGEGAVRCGQALACEALAAGGLATVETRAIPTGDAMLAGVGGGVGICESG